MSIICRAAYILFLSGYGRDQPEDPSPFWSDQFQLQAPQLAWPSNPTRRIDFIRWDHVVLHEVGEERLRLIQTGVHSWV